MSSGEDCSGWRRLLDLGAFGLSCPPPGDVGEAVEQLCGLIGAPRPQWDLLLSVSVCICMVLCCVYVAVYVRVHRFADLCLVASSHIFDTQLCIVKLNVL